MKSRRGTNRSPKIAVFGVFGAGNLGNECTLYAMLHNLRRHLPEASYSCVCSGTEEVASQYNVSAVPIRQGRLPRANNRVLRWLLKILFVVPVELYRWFQVVKVARDHDLLIMTGTGMLSDVGITPFGLHYDILRWSLAARVCRCRVLFVSVGVGPIRSSLSRAFVKWALGAAHYRSYRDNYSREFLETIGFKKSGDSVYPDLAFSLPPAMLCARASDAESPLTVGFGLIAHNRRRATGANDDFLYEEYITKATQFVSWLLERNYRVRLLIGDVGYDERAQTDLLSALEARGLTMNTSAVINERVRSFEDLLAQLADVDLVVSSRFHNVLLSLLLRRPTVAISFHEKVDALMSAFGLEAFRQDIEQIDLEWLKQQFAELEADARQLSVQIGQKADAYRRTLETQYETICRMVGVSTLVTS